MFLLMLCSGLQRNEDGDLLISSSPYESTLFGPTCDSVGLILFSIAQFQQSSPFESENLTGVCLDVIAKNIDLPRLDHGDWLYFLNMGAYTSAASSTFNGMGRPPITYILTVPTETSAPPDEGFFVFSLS